MKDDFSPDDFLNTKTGKPFTHCIECGENIQDGRIYAIEKMVKTYKGFSAQEVIYDFAICMTCMEKLNYEISKESMMTIQAYFAPYMSPEHVSASKGRCIVSGIEKKELTEYQLVGYFKNHVFIERQSAMLISAQVLDDLYLKLSVKTREFLDGFGDKVWMPDPDLEEIRPKILLV